MAIIYGRAAAEKDLLSIAPESVQKIEDVETIHQELKEKLIITKKDFFDKVPDKIIEEEKILEKKRGMFLIINVWLIGQFMFKRLIRYCCGDTW